MKEKVEVGDWSNDGHNQSDTYIIEVPDDVDTAKAFAAGQARIGSGFRLEDYCKHYENSAFPVEHLTTIVNLCAELNIQIEWNKWSDIGGTLKEDGIAGLTEGEFPLAEDDNVNLMADDYFAIWVAIANIGVVTMHNGTPRTLIYEVKAPEGKVHHIGGYGCYSC